MPYEAHRTGHFFWPSGGRKVLTLMVLVDYIMVLVYRDGESIWDGYRVGYSSSTKNSVLDRPVKYADHPAPCAHCPAMWPNRPTLYSDYLAPYADGSNGFARHVAAWVQVSVIRF
jgi:hypothetical protein